MYEIFPDGRVRADTADEVFAMWSRMRKPVVETSDSKPNIEVSNPSCAEDAWSIFVKMLSAGWLAPHQHILSTLKKQDGPIDRDSFRALLGPMFRSNNVVGGMLAGISRHARKAGLDLGTIIIREGTTYRPGSLLRERALPWDDTAQITYSV